MPMSSKAFLANQGTASPPLNVRFRGKADIDGPFRYTSFCQYDCLSLAGGGNEATQ